MSNESSVSGRTHHFGGFFLYSGINHLRKGDEMAPYAKAKGVPAPCLAVKLSGVPLILGGASILLGVKPRIGTMAILGFLVGVSPVMHNFWAQEDPGLRQSEMINFLKNLALAGGALALLGVEEPWEASVAAGRLLFQRGCGKSAELSLRRGMAPKSA